MRTFRNHLKEAQENLRKTDGSLKETSENLKETCETSRTIAEAAKEIIDINGYREKISVLNKKSTDLIVGIDLPRRADLIVSEIFSSEFVGEGVRTTILDANKRLLNL